MKQVLAISVALALSMATIPASADALPPVAVGHASGAAGAWVVGAIGLGAVSVIARASDVGNRERRELTSREATEAIFLPFAWVFFPPDVARTTTVKSAKSNSSDRMGGGGGAKGASGRMGGGGGRPKTQ